MSSLNGGKNQVDKLRIVHIINGLHMGGAEMMLYKLLSGMNRGRFKAEVISLIDGGEIRDKIANLGIKVHSLGIQRNAPGLVGIGRLIRHLRQNPPALVQTWMYHADLIGGVVGKLFTNAPIVWNLRTSDTVRHPDSKRTLVTIKLCAFLSSFIPQRIVSCSQIACQIHDKLGYDSTKLLTIPNGVELANFQPDETAIFSLREELNLASSTRLVGMVARFHPQKDHANFIQAAERLNTLMPDVHFILCGDDITWENPLLSAWISAAGLKSRFHLLGRRKDTPRINAALDVATLSSAYGEGFPNVLVEAMACGVPCVATDSGDAAIIMGETGISVPSRNPEALAHGWLSLLKMSWDEQQRLRTAARQRVIKEYGLSSVVARYEKLYSDLLGLK
jgi:glycosyltransferase involved in cell wall biosynthesis